MLENRLREALVCIEHYVALDTFRRIQWNKAHLKWNGMFRIVRELNNNVQIIFTGLNSKLLAQGRFGKNICWTVGKISSLSGAILLSVFNNIIYSCFKWEDFSGIKLCTNSTLVVLLFPSCPDLWIELLSKELWLLMYFIGLTFASKTQTWFPMGVFDSLCHMQSKYESPSQLPTTCHPQNILPSGCLPYRFW